MRRDRPAAFTAHPRSSHLINTSALEFSTSPRSEDPQEVPSLPFGITHANTAGLREGIQGVINGTANCRILCGGDSLDASACSDAFPLGFRGTARPAKVADLLAARYPSLYIEKRAIWNSAGKATVAAYNAMNPQFVGNSTTVGAGTTIGGFNWQHAATSGAAVITPEGAPFTDIILHYTGPNLTRAIRIQGSNGQIFTIAGDDLFTAKSLPFTFDAPCTNVNIRANTAAAINWMGIEFFTTTAKRISVENCGWNGSDSIDWKSVVSGSGPIRRLEQLHANHLTMHIGTNDCHDSTPLVDFRANLQTIIDAQLTAVGQTYPKSIAFMGLPPLDPTEYGGQTKINDYDAVIEDACNDNGIPFMKLSTYLGGPSGLYSVSLAAGYSYTDLTHITPLGAAKAAELDDMLVAAAMAA
jgi:hypothetical protein